MTTRRLLFVVTHPPNRGALPFELLDELLVAAVFEQFVSVLFMGDGVYQLLNDDATQRSIARAYRALPTYDVESIYVEGSALRRRRLDAGALAVPVRPLGIGAIRRLIADHDIVVPD